MVICVDARTSARVAVIQALYEQEVNSLPLKHNELLDEKARELAAANEFARINKKLFSAIFLKATEEIHLIDDKIINNLSANWSFDRIGGVMRGILRAAIAESLLGEAKKGLIISEYVAIAEGFYEEKEVKFVNAILDKVI